MGNVINNSFGDKRDKRLELSKPAKFFGKTGRTALRLADRAGVGIGEHTPRNERQVGAAVAGGVLIISSLVGINSCVRSEQAPDTSHPQAEFLSEGN